MAEFSLQTHHMKTKNGVSTLSRTTHYVCMRAKIDPTNKDSDVETIYVQGGQFFHGEGQDPIPKGQLPKWAVENLKKMSGPTRASVGLKDDTAPVETKAG